MSSSDARKTIELKPDFPKGHTRLIKAMKEGGHVGVEAIGDTIDAAKEAVGDKGLEELKTLVVKIYPKLEPLF